MMSKIEKVAAICGESQCFHPDDVTNFYKTNNMFLPINTGNPYAAPLEQLKNVLTDACFDLVITQNDRFNPTDEDLFAYAARVTDDISEMLSEKRAVNDEQFALQHKIENVRHFLGLDFELCEAMKTKYVHVNFGRVPISNYQKLKAYENDPFITFFLTDQDSDYYWGIYVAPVDNAREIDRIFAGLYFEPFEIGAEAGTPDDYYQTLLAQVPVVEKKLIDLDYKMAYYLNRWGEKILKYYSKLEQLYTYHTIINKAEKYNDSFILVGWVPAKQADELKTQLEKIESVEFTAADGKDELPHKPPVKLKNFFLARPFEYYTEMYGVPDYNELDPTKFVALTYSVLFGIMFADLGQGFLLLLVAMFMWFKKKMPLGKILIPCAFCSMLFGTIFGSLFGFEHALDPMFHALGFAEKPINIEHSDVKIQIILLALVVGVGLVLVAMLLGIINGIKQRHIGEMIFGVNGICGFVFYSSLLIGLGGQIFMGLQIMNWAYITFLIVLPLILIYLREPLGKLVEGKKNWQPKSWGSYLAEQFFELFEALLSYVTNTMSFIRVGAFVLVHAGMMTVVFLLAKMAGDGTAAYFIVVALGNVFVLVLEALIVGIQVLRLEFFEMFSRFYKGEGRPFKPVKVGERL
jgi:V/A-type H+-transporting ATPase subunit I